MKLKKAVCVYLTLVLFLTGCGNLKSQIRGNQNTDASADQPTGNIIKSDNNEIIEKEETKKLDDKVIGLVVVGDEKEKTSSKEPELMWQDKTKKYAGDAGHFLYEHKGKIAFAVVVATSVYWFGIRPINGLPAQPEVLQLRQRQALQQYQ
ncbi:hypothetical protein [Candidatus Endomicrobiellum trichonymphae]|uniref:Lipoprotein n=1 Tax=Endomicrobium trichonymphae TaxID=1408204 RepID=B1GZ04_ENDTX|nr:hypothetical protein [Candidatus Endomicrobium trichonymphae]BAG13486.1 hypothetical protein TGRD_003 [Candidatus Endomicrobium trichonymphae]